MAVKFIQLTRGQQPIWVNPSTITYICSGAKGGAVVSFVSDRNDYVAVKESPDQVAELVSRALAGEE